MIMTKTCQNESHDWFGEAAECLVRYYFAQRGFTAFGASKWGADSVLLSKDKTYTVEIKSSDCKSWRALKKLLHNKLKKQSSVLSGAHQRLFVAVRLISEDKSDKDEINLGNIRLKIWQAKGNELEPANIFNCQK